MHAFDRLPDGPTDRPVSSLVRAGIPCSAEKRHVGYLISWRVSC